MYCLRQRRYSISLIVTMLPAVMATVVFLSAFSNGMPVLADESAGKKATIPPANTFVYLTALNTSDDETIPFLGIQPGETTLKQVLENPNWGKPSKRVAHKQGEWLHYKIPDYRDVRLFVTEDGVQVIDVTLSIEAPPQIVAAALNLGKFQEAKLGKFAQLDQDQYPKTTIQKFDAGAVVFFVAKDEPIVKFVRYYVPDKSSPTEVVDKPRRVIDQRPPINFFDVIPGQTTKDELLKNKKWGDVVWQIRPGDIYDEARYFGLTSDPDKKSAKIKNDGYELLEFRLGFFPKVVAIVENDVVWAVDVTPPPHTGPEQLVQMFGLGQPMTPQELEIAMSEASPRTDEKDTSLSPDQHKKKTDHSQLFTRVGPRVSPSAWTYENYKGGLAVLFTQEEKGKQEAKLMRIYASIPERTSSLGVQLKPADAELAKQVGLEPEEAVEVIKIFDDSSADKAGLEVGDIITEVSGEKTRSMKELVEYIKQLPVGSQHKIKVIRKKESRELDVVLQKQSLEIAFLVRALGRFHDRLFDEAIIDYNKVVLIAPHDPRGYFQRGVAFRNLRQYDKAIADFNKSIELDPSSKFSYFQRGSLLLDTKKYDEAIADFNEVVRLDPEYGLGYASRGYTWSAKKEYDNALNDYNEAIRLLPEDPVVYNNRGIMWISQGEPDKAIADYSEAIRINPNYALAYTNRGFALNRKEEYDKAVEDHSQAIRLNPQDARAHLNRGVAWKNKGDLDKALADYTEALRINPKYALAYANRGYIWNEKKEPDKALEDLTQAIRLNPKDQRSYLNRGVAWKSKDELDKAFADYNAALRLKPNYALAYLNRGNVWVAKKEFDKALEDYNQAIRLNPQDSRSYYRRAKYWKDQGELDKAYKDFSEVLRLDPKYTLAYAHRGYISHIKKEYDNALEDYDRALEIDQSLKVTYLNRAIIRNKQSQYSKALTDLDRAIELNPKYAKAYASRGLSWFKMSEFDKSLADYNEAIRLDPTQSSTYRSRGAVYKQLGQNDKAAVDFKKADELSSKSKKAKPENAPPPPAPVP